MEDKAKQRQSKGHAGPPVHPNSPADRSNRFMDKLFGRASRGTDWDEVDPKNMVGLEKSDVNTAPIAPVIRPGHFEYMHPSLLPNEDSDTINDTIPLNELEKSSDSFLKHLQSPPSTASEDEAGQLGCKECKCFSKTVHWIDPMFKQPGEADQFTIVILFFVIFTYVPALLGSVLYFVCDSCRLKMLESSDTCFYVFFSMIAVYAIFNYFSGVARHYPFHILMIVSKSLCFGVGVTFAAACFEYIWIRSRVLLDPRFVYQSDDVKLSEDLFMEYVNNTEGGYGHEGILPHHSVHLFLFAIIYTMLIKIATFFAIIFTQLTIFGALYPMITYSMTFAIILIGVWMTVYQAFGFFALQHLYWDVGQIILGPVLGLYFTDSFVYFLENLFNGKVCPLKNSEFFYAVAHY